ncbi:MAG TPA: hypothetical protein VH350_05660 [Candidatus Sulfotelmatobacter sp.]|nr:hypothetical protein [Candidatus Sulfotelmatobacter sp.]
MRSLRGLSIFLCVLMTVALATAKTNSMGVRDVSHVTFVAPVRVGTVVMPAGDYVVRHTMEGENHIMVFQRAHSKDEFKVKCTLVPLPNKAQRSETVYQFTAGNERILQELIFQGDTSKHVF